MAVILNGKIQGGTGTGAGFTLGPETNQFTGANEAAAETARDTYETANPTWLADYDAEPSFLIELTYGTTVAYQRRTGSAWQDVTNLIKGEEGNKGDKGDTGDADLQIGNAFPASPSSGDIFIFDQAATGLTNAVENDGSTSLSAAEIGETFKYDGTNWVLEVETGVNRSNVYTESKNIIQGADNAVVTTDDTAETVSVSGGPVTFAMSTAYAVGRYVEDEQMVYRVTTAVPDTNTSKPVELPNSFRPIFSRGIESEDFEALSDDQFRIQFPSNPFAWDQHSWTITFGNDAAWKYDPLTRIFTYYGGASTLTFPVRVGAFGTGKLGRGHDSRSGAISFTNYRLEYRKRNDSNSGAWGSWTTIYIDTGNRTVANSATSGVRPASSTEIEITLNQDVATNGRDDIEFRWNYDVTDDDDRAFITIFAEGFDLDGTLDGSLDELIRLEISVTTGRLVAIYGSDDPIEILDINRDVNELIDSVNHIPTRIFIRSASRPDTATGGTWNGREFTAPTDTNLDYSALTGTDQLYTADVQLYGDGETIRYSDWYPISGTSSGGGGLSAVSSDATLSGDGTSSDPLGIADGGVDTTQLADDAIDSDKVADDAIRDEHVASDLSNTEQQNIRTKIGAGSATGGITAVTSDATLSGDGTTSDPLGIADDGVGTTQLADDAVTQAKIGDNAVQEPNLASNSVISEKIRADAVTGAKVADDAIDTEHIADSAVDTAQIADDAIDGDKIDAGAVIGAHIFQDAITSSKIADDAVETAKIADDAVTNAKVADDAIQNAQLANNSVRDEQIAGDLSSQEQQNIRTRIGAGTGGGSGLSAVSSDATLDGDGTSSDPLGIADGGVDTTQLADSAVETGKINNQSVTNAKIGSGAITTTKISSNAVTNDKVADSAIDTAELADAAVETAKIADDAVNGDKIAANAIISAHIFQDAITPSKIETNAVETDKIDDDAVTAAKIADNAVGAGQIASDAVTNAKIADDAVQTIQIQDGAVTQDKLASGVGGSVADGGITTAKLADGAVTTPKVADGAISAAKLASGLVTPFDAAPESRAESVTLQAKASVHFPDYSTAINIAATNPITVEYGGGDAEILSGTAGGGSLTVAKAGVYVLKWRGSVDVSIARPIPTLNIYNNTDTIGTDTPITSISAAYIRYNLSNVDFVAVGLLVVPADNTVIKFATSVAVGGADGADDADQPAYSLDAGSKIYFARGAAAGLTEAEVEDFVSEHVSHTIRRRNIVGGGVLQVGDARIDADSIEINVDQDTEDGWFGDLEAGAEIRIHGLTSGARSMYTLVSVTESGDDATLTVTRDSHNGIFSHNETIVIVFDQEHAPQSDWDEADSNRPAFIKNKPTLAPSDAEANVQADWDEATTTDDAYIQNKPTLAPSGAEANVQADWDEATTTDDAYIQNKPTVLTQADVEDITSEHIVHVIRRRLVIGGGVLQRGDVRIGATTIEINTHDDTDDGWFGELPTGTAIIIRGLTSGTRRIATLQSVSESGDDATLTVTFDSTGVFSNNETVIMTFDQAHTSQSDWDETDTDRPAFIKNKPTYFNNPRSFYYGRGGADAQIQSSRVDVVVTDFGSGTIRSTLRFQTTADETDFGGSDSLATWTDADDNSNIDVAGVFRRDDSVFELPAGTYDISFYLKTQTDESDNDATIYLAQIQSGTDDILITDVATTDSSDVASSNTTIEFHYKSLRASSGALFYFAEQGFIADHTAAYYVVIERLA